MKMGQQRPDVVQIGYFGSYARGDWGVGSDLDLCILVEKSQVPFARRSAEWDTNILPVPTDVCVYTQIEWADMARQAGRFYRHIMREAVWVYHRSQKS